jgi:transaldolase
MPIFLDTTDKVEIERFHRMGVIRGVTTNPTMLLKEGVGGGLPVIEEHLRDIAEMIAPLPLSVEVTTNQPARMIEEAQTIAGWAPNIAVKITVHGPDGELENMEVIHELESVHNIRVNVTAMMSAQQCLLAAMAGATWVSIFGGRVNNMGYNAAGEIRKLRGLLDRFRLKSWARLVKF